MDVVSLEADEFSGLFAKRLLLLGQHALLHISSIICWRPVRWGSLPCICFGSLAICGHASVTEWQTPSAAVQGSANTA